MRGIAERRGGGIVVVVENEFIAVGRHNRRAMAACDRQAGEHPPLPWRDAALPRAPQHDISMAHQEAVAGVARRVGVVACRGVIEMAQSKFEAAIEHVVEDAPVVAAHVGRLQQAEIDAIFYLPGGVARRAIEIDDTGIESMAGIHRAAHASGDFLIGSDTAELDSVEYRLDAGNLNLHGTASARAVAGQAQAAP